MAERDTAVERGRKPDRSARGSAERGADATRVRDLETPRSECSVESGPSSLRVADPTPYDPSYIVEAVIKAMEPPAPVALAAIRKAKAAYDKRYPKGT